MSTVCLCMIVRDESAVIERCLASVRGLIDSWVICDTGRRPTAAQPAPVALVLTGVEVRQPVGGGQLREVLGQRVRVKRSGSRARLSIRRPRSAPAAGPSRAFA